MGRADINAGVSSCPSVCETVNVFQALTELVIAMMQTALDSGDMVGPGGYAMSFQVVHMPAVKYSNNVSRYVARNIGSL